jgi:hypothetical protein
MVPYIQAAADDVRVALDRAERVAACLPAAWFGKGPVREAQPLMNVLHGLARHLESQRGDTSNSLLAKHLSQILAKLGDQGRSSRLSAAYNL